MMQGSERPTFSNEQLNVINEAVASISSDAFEVIEKRLDELGESDDLQREVLMEVVTSMATVAACLSFDIASKGVIECFADMLSENVTEKLKTVKVSFSGDVTH